MVGCKSLSWETGKQERKCANQQVQYLLLYIMIVRRSTRVNTHDQKYGARLLPLSPQASSKMDAFQSHLLPNLLVPGPAYPNPKVPIFLMHHCFRFKLYVSYHLIESEYSLALYSWYLYKTFYEITASHPEINSTMKLSSLSGLRLSPTSRASSSVQDVEQGVYSQHSSTVLSRIQSLPEKIDIP